MDQGHRTGVARRTVARRKPGEPHPLVTPDLSSASLQELEARGIQQLESAARR